MNMFSSKIWNFVHPLKNNTAPCRVHINFLSTSTASNFYQEERNKENNKPERKLKEWREPLLPVPESAKDIGDPDKGFFKIFKANIPLTPWGMKQHLNNKRLNMERQEQKYNSLRCQILGWDLSLAYLLLWRGGKVKFKDHSEWIVYKSKQMETILPTKYDVNYILEEIDVSDVLLFYEILENFENTSRIKKVIFKNSPLFDDWFMDKISTVLPYLEYLDVSNCPKLSERGLEGLYRAINLKKLIITNHNKSAVFELTCMMLEDCLPLLKIEILDPVNETSNVNK